MKIKMKLGLSGPKMSLAPGDTKDFNDAEGQRLIDAGFAELVLDEVSSVAETSAERVARLQEELQIAQADLDAEGAPAQQDADVVSDASVAPAATEIPAKTSVAKPPKLKA